MERRREREVRRGWVVMSLRIRREWGVDERGEMLAGNGERGSWGLEL